jgi:hypothetical protein
MDLEQIRDTLAAGRKPKVVFTEAAGQISGQFGQVVQLTDPELSDEWVVVRFGKDELPFSPADLAIAPKASPARRTNVPSPREESPVPAAPALSTVDTSASAETPAPLSAPDRKTASGKPADTARSTDNGRPADAARPADNGRQADTAAVRPADNGKAADAAAVDAKAAERRPAAPRKVAKPKAPPGLTVTLAYGDGDWTVAANQGSKALAKPYVIKPSEALKMVSLLDVPGVHEAVEEIVTAARTEAQRQAERLRAELAEIESRLAELREAE